MKDSSKMALIKRGADGLEKLSIGALLLGIFQFNYYALFVGSTCFLASMALTYIMEERK